MSRAKIYAPRHPLALPDGGLRRSRAVLYDTLNGESAPCHWCGLPLFWRTDLAQTHDQDALCADHLDGDVTNDDSANLVPACRACNANRTRNGTGRRVPVPCATCGNAFFRHHLTARFCSRACQAKANEGPRGSTAAHGTRSRYNYGCRCGECRAENARAWRVWANSKATYAKAA